MNVLELHALPRDRMAAMLAEHAPLQPVPLCPEIRAHHAHSLVAVWEAAETLAGRTLPAPFWAYPWAAGSALARVLLDEPSYVLDRCVLDFGAGGGVSSFAAAKAGAAHVVANDIDATALLVCSIGADAQQLAVETLHADLCEDAAAVDKYDVVLCSDLSYERQETPRQRLVLERARRLGATVLVADAGRKYFDETGMQLIAQHSVRVPVDLEGGDVRVARVFRMM